MKLGNMRRAGALAPCWRKYNFNKQNRGMTPSLAENKRIAVDRADFFE